MRYPSSGGLIAYLMQGFGNGRLVGIASWLGYFAAIVIVGSMVAVAFGSLCDLALRRRGRRRLVGQRRSRPLIVVAMAAINLVGSRVVDRAQSLIVVVLLAVFAVFIAVTIVDIDPDLLAFSGYPPVSDIIASVALTFFAYLGFSVITFAVGDLRDPARELPKAMYVALGVTTVLYVLISLGVFGTLTVPEVVGYGETAIAEAARPALGDAGFTMVAIAALLATASSVNATLYASGGLDEDARRGQASSRRSSGARSRLGPHAGMLITAALVLVISNLVDLSAIASVGSACSLVIFLLVGVSAFPAAGRDRLAGGHRADGDRGDRCRARLLRRRHPAQRAGDVCGDRRHHGALRGSGLHLEAGARAGAPNRRLEVQRFSRLDDPDLDVRRSSATSRANSCGGSGSGARPIGASVPQ